MIVSILIPNYNHGATLERAVVSCLRQGLPPHQFEVLLLDDGSTDGSWLVMEALVREYGTRLNVRALPLMHEGLSRTLNAGLVWATGEWVQRLDADDELAPSWLLQVEPHLYDEDLDLLYGRFQPGAWQPDDFDLERLRLENHLPYCTLFRRRAALALDGFSVGVVDELGIQDWDLWLKLAYAHRGVAARALVNQQLVYHADQGNRLSAAGFLASDREAALRAVKRTYARLAPL